MANTIEILIKARDEASQKLQAAASAVGGLTGFAARLAQSAGPVGAVAAAATGIASSVFLAAKSLADYGEQLQNIAARSGASVQQVQVLRTTLESAGLGADLANQALTFLNRAISTQDPLLKALGITTTNAYEALLQLGDAFRGSSDTAAKNEISFRLLGRAGTDLLPVLDSLRDKTGEVRNSLAEGGGLLSDETVKNLEELDGKIDQFTVRWEGFMTRIKAAAASAVLDILNVTDKLNVRPDETDNSRNLRLVREQIALNESTKGASQEFIKALKEREKALSLVVLQEQNLITADGYLVAGTYRAAEATIDLGKAADDTRKKQKAQKEETISLAEAISRLKQLQPETRGEPKFGLGVPEIPQPVAPQFGEQVEEFGRQVQEELRTATTATEDLIYALQNDMEIAFSDAFSRLLEGTTNFKNAMIDTFKSMVDALIRELARLAAIKVLKFLVDRATGGATAAVPIEYQSIGEASLSGAPNGTRVSGGAGGRTLSRESSLTREDLVSAFAEAMQRVGFKGGDTFNISALDTRTAYDAIVSPQGGFRRANDRLRELAAVS